MINTDYFNKWNELDKSIKSNSSKERITKFIPTNSANNVFISNTYKLERSFSTSLFKISYESNIMS